MSIYRVYIYICVPPRRLVHLLCVVELVQLHRKHARARLRVRLVRDGLAEGTGAPCMPHVAKADL